MLIQEQIVWHGIRTEERMSKTNHAQPKRRLRIAPSVLTSGCSQTPQRLYVADDAQQLEEERFCAPARQLIECTHRCPGLARCKCKQPAHVGRFNQCCDLCAEVLKEWN